MQGEGSRVRYCSRNRINVVHSCALFLGLGFVLGPGDVKVNEADMLPQGPHSPVEGRGGRELTYSVVRALTED